MHRRSGWGKEGGLGGRSRHSVNALVLLEKYGSTLEVNEDDLEQLHTQTASQKPLGDPMQCILLTIYAWFIIMV